MDTLILEDFRCFAGRHEVPIRPLTLLVGENSTGKTSFLAAMRAAHDLRTGTAPDFNEEPFLLGSYDQIANYRGGSAPRAKAFAIGQESIAKSRLSPRTRRRVPGKQMRIEASFTSDKAQPAVSHFSVAFGEHALQLTSTGERAVVSFSVGPQVLITREVRADLWTAHLRFPDDFWFNLRRAIDRPRELNDDGLTDEEQEHFDALTGSARYGMDARPYAFAPIRSSPRRTYDPTKEVRDPEGSHTPMMLARLLENGAKSEFRQAIERFGFDSGLYSRLGIRKLGRTGSDPFQIEVKQPSGGRARNLVDVGYGVSQAIPIIADCLSAEPTSALLIQQPEVHLHPRAQAAMGSFFAQLAASERNQLVVETHSDYLVDRIRMDVRDERIRPSDVVILYFEQGRGSVDIYPIELDAAGRVVGVPDGYRSFFMEEQRRFFGVD